MEAKKLRLKGQDRVKGDQRILGATVILYWKSLRRPMQSSIGTINSRALGYDLKSVEQRVSGIYQIDPEEIYLRSREKIRAEARSLFCYWAVRELGYGLTDLAKRPGMNQPGVGYAVSRGERIAKQNNY
jgi:hypothetical protein